LGQDWPVRRQVGHSPDASQFQRADCAPRSTLGNGAITVTDWVQAGRYAAGLDPLTPQAGPPRRLIPGGWCERRNSRCGDRACPSDLRSHNRSPTRETNRIPVCLTALGNETAVGFSINFDQSVLTFVSASVGGNLPGALLNVNTSQTTTGRVAWS